MTKRVLPHVGKTGSTSGNVIHHIKRKKKSEDHINRCR